MFKNSRSTLPWLGLVLLAVFATACTFSLAQDVTPPSGALQSQSQPVVVQGPYYPLMAPDVSYGAEIYAEKCASCHGDTGLGDGAQAGGLSNPVAAIGDLELARNSTPAEWFEVVSNGRMDKYMPGFQSLDDRDRWDVVAFTFTLSVPPEIVESGQVLYQTNCLQCHGQFGSGDGEEAVGLQMPSFTDQERMASLSAADLYAAISGDSASEQHDFSGQLSSDEIWSLTAVLRLFSFASHVGGEESVDLTIPSDMTPEPEDTPAIEETPEPEETLAAEDTPAADETPEATAAPGDEDYYIDGRITNGSDAPLPPDLEVTLYAFEHGTGDSTVDDTFPMTVTADEEGYFIFENIKDDMTVNRIFQVEVIHEGVSYLSDPAFVMEETYALTLDVTVYDSTTDTTDLEISRLHILFMFDDTENVQVIEMYVVTNHGDETVVASADDTPLLVFSLPEGYAGLRFQTGSIGNPFISIPGGFGDPSPILPGEESYQMLVGYSMVYDRGIDFVHDLHLPVGAVIVMVQSAGVTLQSDLLVFQSTGPLEQGGPDFDIYQSGGRAGGSELTFSLSGRIRLGEQTSLFNLDSQSSLFIGLFVLGVVLVGTGYWFYRRAKVEEETLVDDEEEEDALLSESDTDALMDAIIALDDLYQAGDLPESAYRQRRAALKDRLKELTGE